MATIAADRHHHRLVAVVLIYNGLVSLRNQVQNGWKQIDVQLKRRHDLIPNLVETVKGAMQFERDTLERVMQARARAVRRSGDGRARAAAENEAVAIARPPLRRDGELPDAEGERERRSSCRKS